MDSGICPGNYFDYPDDDIAIQREFEIGDAVEEGEVYADEAFPANARSLYFDPLNPPKGAIPNESVSWNSIAQGSILHCEQPVTYNGDAESSIIMQGSLGDGYFVNALRLIANNPALVNRIIVSDKFAHRGMYTCKFYKAGKWRYVHIDDKMPCRQSGRVNFCRNHNVNEVFAMVIEKAYAKLHGCYEALAYGLTEKVMADLTPAAGIQTIRAEQSNRRTICDDMWETIERGVKLGRLLGCSRLIPDPYGENPSFRCGIALGIMYQVIDVCVASAEATEDLDALTVGMVCVRNLQHNTGRYNGRWCYGHKLWLDYKEIAKELRHRTKQIQYHRGLGPDPDADNIKEEDEDNDGENNDDASAMSGGVSVDGSLGRSKGGGGGGDGKKNTKSKYKKVLGGRTNVFPGDEPDVLKLGYVSQMGGEKVVQPFAEDLHWIQIEDFVDLFNRVYICTDLSVLEHKKYSVCRRFVSKWIPGDYVAGSGGPPVIVTKEKVEDDEEDEEDNFGGDGTGPEPSLEQSGSLATGNGPSGTVESSAVSSSRPATVATVDDEYFRGNSGSKPTRYTRIAQINDNFTDNPMYPFSVTENATMCINVYQADKRWCMGRLGDDPLSIKVDTFANRGSKMEACMQYSTGLGFIVVKLCGLKNRLTEFRLKKMVAGCEAIQFASSVGNTVQLRPGRYAIIPYTHCEQSASFNYVLHVQFLSTQVEFEVEDVIAQRLVDDMPSDDEDDGPEDNELLFVREKKKGKNAAKPVAPPGGYGEGYDLEDEISLLSYEKVDAGRERDDEEEDEDEEDEDEDEDEEAAAERKRIALAEAATQPLRAPPLLRAYRRWEYCENSDELGIKTLYDEVGDMMVYLRSLKGEMRQLNQNFRSFVSATEYHNKNGAGDMGVVPQISQEEAEKIIMQQKLNAAMASM